ncbi:MAG TPA: hypothetical protein VFP22_02890 [Candidatus Limnocylindrales bacterium]|nr:hypothetical protein [Candidatus Limnocylindrales bacterium]
MLGLPGEGRTVIADIFGALCIGGLIGVTVWNAGAPSWAALGFSFLAFQGALSLRKEE